jgi:hypothetical protein
MGIFLNTYKLVKLSKRFKKYLSSTVTFTGIEAGRKSLTTNEKPGLDKFTAESY